MSGLSNLMPSKKNNQLLRITFLAGVSREEGGPSKTVQNYDGGVEYLVPAVNNKLEISNLGCFLSAAQRDDVFGCRKIGRITELNIPEDVVIDVLANRPN